MRAISDLERGVNRHPHSDTLRLLSDALRLSAADRSALIAATQRQVESSFNLLHGRASSASASGTPSFVGRQRELAVLARHLAGDGPPLLLLAGEPGIGKTRLLREVAQGAVGYGLRVLEGGCHRTGQEPYQPIMGALTDFIHTQAPEQLRADLRDCAWLARVLPELPPDLIEATPTWTVSPEQERRLIFGAVSRYLTQAAGPAGVLLALDDLQWAGADALDLLATLTRGAARASLRIVAAYRATESPVGSPLNRMVADLAREALVAQKRVGALAPAEAAALLDELLGGLDAHPARIDALLRRTERVPFFLVTCAQAERAGASPDDQAGGEPSGVPWDVAESIRQRVYILPPAAQELVGAAAVAGRRFPRALALDLARRFGHEERVALAALEAACHAGLLEEDGERDYQFAHDLVREVIEGGLSAARHSSIHRAIAAYLEVTPEQAPAALVAYHYTQSDDKEKELTYLIRAAEDAHSAAAYRDEASLLGQALDLAEQANQRDLANELHVQRGRAFRTVARWPEADAELQRALQTLPAEQVEQRIHALLDRAEVRHWLYDPTGIRSFAIPALALAEQAQRDDLAAQAMCRLALADSSEGNVQESVERYERAFERAGPDHIATVVSGVEYSGLNLYWLGAYEAAVERSRKAVALAHAAQETTYLARAQANLGLALTGSGRYSEAQRVFDEARQFARQHQIGQWLARSTAMYGGLYLDLFDFGAAQTLAEEAREISRSLGWPQALASGGIDLLLNYARRQEIGAAETLLPEVIEAVMGAQGEHGWLWRLRLAQARAEIALGRADWSEALHWADDAILQSQRRGRVKYQVAGLKARAEAFAALGRRAEALVSLRRAVSLARPVGDPAMLLRASTALLALDGDDALAAEARSAADRIADALPDDAMRARFRAAEPIRLIERLAP